MLIVETIEPGSLGRRAGWTKRGARGIVSPQTILPGATVNLRLTRLTRLTRLRGTLPRGRYRVGVALTQAGHRVGGLRTGIHLR